MAISPKYLCELVHLNRLIVKEKIDKFSKTGNLFEKNTVSYNIKWECSHISINLKAVFFLVWSANFLSNEKNYFRRVLRRKHMEDCHCCRIPRIICLFGGSSKRIMFQGILQMFQKTFFNVTKLMLCFFRYSYWT